MGETVARPVFHEFPHDNNTHGIDKQFMWGRSVLISPFLFEAKIISSFIKN
jgi:alpha-glucosidase (family GH31 glycosyl hydrolase)